MAKRKRREKKARGEGPNEIQLPHMDSGEGTDVASEQAINDAEVPAEAIPPFEVGSAEKANFLEADDTQPRKKRRKNQPAVSHSGHENIEPVQDPVQAEGETIPKSLSQRSRYILFVGNLPYDTTNTSIQNHFSALAPGFTVRHSTDKATGRSRGFAFLEFENDALMRRCLKGYHHSIFYADTSDRPGRIKKGELADEQEMQGIHPSRLERMNTSKPRSKPTFSAKDQEAGGRRINIELTAGGGGGKSTARKEKLKAKNQKLSEERARVRQTQLKLREATERNKLRAKKKSKQYGSEG